jgi:hypothetical protein
MRTSSNKQDGLSDEVSHENEHDAGELAAYNDEKVTAFS